MMEKAVFRGRGAVKLTESMTENLDLSEKYEEKLFSGNKCAGARKGRWVV